MNMRWELSGLLLPALSGKQNLSVCVLLQIETTEEAIKFKYFLESDHKEARIYFESRKPSQSKNEVCRDQRSGEP